MRSGAHMHPTTGQVLISAVSVLLEAVVLACAVQRRLYTRLPVFTGYLAILVTRELTLSWFYLGLGYSSRPAFYYFWITQGILVVARAAAVVEIAWRALHGYRGVWALGWRLLCLVGL